MVKTAVIIETSRYQIVGNVTVPSDVRLSDYACDPERSFFAVTEVLMSPLDNPERERAVDFILVARHEVGLMRPGFVEQAKTTEQRWAFDDVVANPGFQPVTDNPGFVADVAAAPAFTY